MERGSPVAFPRQINDARRVGLPHRLTEPVGLKKEGGVLVSKARNASGVVMLRPAGATLPPQGSWVRTLTRSRQLCLPEELMTDLEWDRFDWVYVTTGSDGTSLRLFAAGAAGTPKTPHASTGSMVGPQ